MNQPSRTLSRGKARKWPNPKIPLKRIDSRQVENLRQICPQSPQAQTTTHDTDSTTQEECYCMIKRSSDYVDIAVTLNESDSMASNAVALRQKSVPRTMSYDHALRKSIWINSKYYLKETFSITNHVLLISKNRNTCYEIDNPIALPRKEFDALSIVSV